MVVGLACGWGLQWDRQHDALRSERDKLKWQLESTAYLLEQQNITLDVGETKVALGGAVRRGLVVTSVEAVPSSVAK